MKRKLSILLFSLMFGSVVFAGNIIKTEYITETVCEAIAGCWLNPLVTPTSHRKYVDGPVSGLINLSFQSDCGYL